MAVVGTGFTENMKAKTSRHVRMVRINDYPCAFYPVNRRIMTTLQPGIRIAGVPFYPIQARFVLLHAIVIDR